MRDYRLELVLVCLLVVVIGGTYKLGAAASGGRWRFLSATITFLFWLLAGLLVVRAAA
jgi:hypothetical protein